MRGEREIFVVLRGHIFRLCVKGLRHGLDV